MKLLRFAPHLLAVAGAAAMLFAGRLHGIGAIVLLMASAAAMIAGAATAQADIGKRHGISAERVRQLERQALATLRRIADPDLAA